MSPRAFWSKSGVSSWPWDIKRKGGWRGGVNWGWPFSSCSFCNLTHQCVTSARSLASKSCDERRKDTYGKTDDRLNTRKLNCNYNTASLAMLATHLENRLHKLPSIFVFGFEIKTRTSIPYSIRVTPPRHFKGSFTWGQTSTFDFLAQKFRSMWRSKHGCFHPAFLLVIHLRLKSLSPKQENVQIYLWIDSRVSKEPWQQFSTKRR